jgi:hypothetical protein
MLVAVLVLGHGRGDRGVCVRCSERAPCACVHARCQSGTRVAVRVCAHDHDRGRTASAVRPRRVGGVMVLVQGSDRNHPEGLVTVQTTRSGSTPGRHGHGARDSEKVESLGLSCSPMG